MDRRGVDFASCPYWDYALTHWLDIEPPHGDSRGAVCDRDFAIARVLAYLGAVTRPSWGSKGGHTAGFPVISVRADAERPQWMPRVERWNDMLLDPWRRICVIDAGVVIDAVVGLRVRERWETMQEVADGRN